MIGYIKIAAILSLLSSVSCFGSDENLPANLVQLYTKKLHSEANLEQLRYLEKLAAPEEKIPLAAQRQKEQSVLSDTENALAKMTAESKSAFPPPPLALSYLQKHFPKAERLSSLHWQAIHDLFGAATEEAFLQSTYQANSFIPHTVTARENEHLLVVFVHDPFLKVSASIQADSWKPVNKSLKKCDLQAAMQSLKSGGYQTIDFELSAFSSMDAIAEEFAQFIRNNTEGKTQSLILVSTGEGSAIVHHYLDIKSGARRNAQVKAWINYNGRLHGFPLPKLGREIASVKTKKSPADKQEEEMVRNVLQLQEERGIGNPSLGDGFPIYNFVSWQNKDRPTTDIQDAFESNAKSYLLTSPQAPNELANIIRDVSW
jgi:hypothetical protein